MILKNPYDVVRSTLIRRKFKSVGKNTSIAPDVTVGDGKSIIIGDNCCINQYVSLIGKGGLTIGDNTHISSYSAVLTGFLDFKTRKHKYKPITIGSDVWIASHSIIGAGVIIGRGSIIGANSTVLHDIPALVFAVGSPAKVKRKLVKGLE